MHRHPRQLIRDPVPLAGHYALHPNPNFLIMAKNDFLSGAYLSTNFGRGKGNLVLNRRRVWKTIPLWTTGSEIPWASTPTN